MVYHYSTFIDHHFRKKCITQLTFNYFIVAGDLDIRIAGKFRLGKKIGGGSFGDIYLATEITTGEEVAVKVEDTKTKHPQLHTECKFYKVRHLCSLFVCLYIHHTNAH